MAGPSRSVPTGMSAVAVAAAEDEVLPTLVDDVGIAAINAPKSVVVSGEQAAVTAIADQFAAQGRRVHQLAVSHAFHSPLMQPAGGADVPNMRCRNRRRKTMVSANHLTPSKSR